MKHHPFGWVAIIAGPILVALVLIGNVKSWGQVESPGDGNRRSRTGHP